jgi:hypothetical protein
LLVLRPPPRIVVPASLENPLIRFFQVFLEGLSVAKRCKKFDVAFSVFVLFEPEDVTETELLASSRHMMVTTVTRPAEHEIHPVITRSFKGSGDNVVQLKRVSSTTVKVAASTPSMAFAVSNRVIIIRSFLH